MGYVFLPGFEFLRVLMLSRRLGLLPHDTTSDDQWLYPMPSDRTHAGSSQFWFLVQWLCNIYGLVSPPQAPLQCAFRGHVGQGTEWAG